ncbi:hypothetical protein Scep_010405 [Stephania cephalantha]|uniref:Uncharacterized protein n=1 Tax=Stephania cephalantha TaxID=152367 RepID=A0AAP0PF66_9MAGN
MFEGNYLINYLATRGTELQPFVHGLSKVPHALSFTFFLFTSNQATSDHYAIGLKILNQLVSEMNQVSPVEGSL